MKSVMQQDRNSQFKDEVTHFQARDATAYENTIVDDWTIDAEPLYK